MKLKTIVLSLVCAALFAPALRAQDADTAFKRSLSIKFDARVDGKYDYFTKTSSDQFGFYGKYIFFQMAGDINRNISYGYRARLIKDNAVPNLFDATDWMWVKFKFNKNFSLSFGKEVLQIGGYEYDRNPMDVYFFADFWSNMAPFQLGGTLHYLTDDGKHNIRLQISNSLHTTKLFESILCYNLIWYGNFGWFKPMYSLNFFEVERGKFINYISLGNRFEWGLMAWELDYTNRAALTKSNNKFFSDFSVISNMDFAVSDKWVVFVKGGYEQNKAEDPLASFAYDRLVHPGDSHYYYGAGFEYYPLVDQRNNVRIHAFLYSGNYSGTPVSFNVGVRWQMYLINR